MTNGSPAGLVWLRPGAARPHNLRSTRPDGVGQVTVGMAAARLPTVLGNLFSLCGHAHRLCAALAIGAAQGGQGQVDTGSLEHETLREHLRRIWLDWPRWLGGGDADLAVLARLPAQGDSGAWLADAVFGMPAADWLRGWSAEPADWLADWARRAGTLPARLLRGVRHVAEDPTEAAPPLRVADVLPIDPRETGPWTRLHGVDAPPTNAWLRLGSRLAEVARLSLRDQMLDRGARCRRDGTAVAWVEMARGLLIHELRLDADGRVVHCRVHAPTDCNFHPRGAVARALETIAPDDAGRVAALMAAYDPCVPYRIEQPQEAAHA